MRLIGIAGYAATRRTLAIAASVLLGILTAIGLPAGLRSAAAAANGTPVLFPYVGNNGSYPTFLRINNITGPTNPFGAPPTPISCAATVAGDDGTRGTTTIESSLAAGSSDLVAISTIMSNAGVNPANNRAFLIVSCNSPFAYFTVVLLSPNGTVAEFSGIPMQQSATAAPVLFPYVGNNLSYPTFLRINNVTGPTNPFGAPPTPITCTAAVAGDDGTTGTATIESSLAAGSSDLVAISTIMSNAGVSPAITGHTSLFPATPPTLISLRFF